MKIPRCDIDRVRVGEVKLERNDRETIANIFLFFFFDDDDVYCYNRWRLKLEGETENICVCTKERKGVSAEVLRACTSR